MQLFSRFDRVDDDQHRIVISSPDVAPKDIQLVIAWPDGERQTIQLTGDTDGPTFYEYDIDAMTQPFRYAAFGGNTRTRWIEVQPKQYPVIDRLNLTLIHDEQRLRLNPARDEPIRAAVGCELLIEVSASPDDARLTAPNAEGTALRVPVQQGEQTIELELITDAGLKSQQPQTITLVGLSQTQIDTINAELAGGELPEGALSLPVAADALASAVAFGSPDEAAAAELSSGTPVESEATGNEPRENGTGSSGDGVGGDGSETQPPPLVDAVGVLAARYEVTGEQLQNLRQLVQSTPAAYRDLVAEFYLKRQKLK